MAVEPPVAPAVLGARFAAQLLTGQPARSAEQVVGRLLAVQGQDPRGARLAIRVRSAGLTAADVDRALTGDRSLLISWLNRGTLHLVRSEDYWWLHALTTPPLSTGCARRLAQEGVPPDDADRAVAVIEAAVSADGPQTRRQLGERIAVAGVRTQGQALVHLLFLASLRGLIVRGPMIGGEHAFAAVRDWLGAAPEPLDRDRALAELARRYLAGHGPADDRDLAKWAGLPLGDARRGLSAIASQLSERDDGLADLADREPIPPFGQDAAGPAGDAAAGPLGQDAGGPTDRGGIPARQPATDPDHARAAGDPRVPSPRLLGAFDPLLLGWVSREPILGQHQGIVTTNGLFRPFALVGGKATAIWRLSDGKVTFSPLTAMRAADQAALDADGADVRRFLGYPGARAGR